MLRAPEKTRSGFISLPVVGRDLALFAGEPARAKRASTWARMLALASLRCEKCHPRCESVRSLAPPYEPLLGTLAVCNHANPEEPSPAEPLLFASSLASPGSTDDAAVGRALAKLSGPGFHRHAPVYPCASQTNQAGTGTV